MLFRSHHVAAAQDRGIAGEAAAGIDADQGRHARQSAKNVEGHGVEAGHRLDVDVARAAERVLRVARTIADLDDQPAVGTQAIAEALTYRSFDQAL